MATYEEDALARIKAIDTKYSITPEGRALSDTILSYITQIFSASIPPEEVIGTTDFAPENIEQITVCFQSYGRIDNFKMHKCIENGIRDYIRYYSTVKLKTIGVSTPPVPDPTAIPVVIDDAFGFDHQGELVFTKDLFHKNMFTIFSLGRLFGLGIPEMTAGNTGVIVEEFFNDIVTWVGGNLAVGDIVPDGVTPGSVSAQKNKEIVSASNTIFVESSGFHNDTYITTSTGNILFIIPEQEYTNLVANVNSTLSILNNENISYYNENNESIEFYFETVWGVICTGIVKYLNYNECTTKDGGYSIVVVTDPITGNEVTKMYDYSGNSMGAKDAPFRAVFGDKYFARADVTALEINGIISIILKITGFLSLDNAMIRLYESDMYGNLKMFNFQLLFKPLALNILRVQESVNEFLYGEGGVFAAINGVFDKIAKMLFDIGLPFDYIANKLAEISIQASGVVNDLIEKAFKFISDTVTSKVEKFILMWSVRLLRVQAWIILKANVVTSAFALTYLAITDGINKAISEFGQATVIRAIIETYNVFVASLKKAQIMIYAKLLSLTGVIIQLGPEFCFDVGLPQLPSIPEPMDVPAPPTEQDLEEQQKQQEEAKQALEVVMGGIPLPNAPSDQISFDENGNLINEPVVGGMAEAVARKATPKPDVTPIKTTPPSTTSETELSTKYNPIVVVGAPNKFYQHVSTYKTSDSMKKHIKNHEEIGGKCRLIPMKDISNNGTYVVGWGCTITGIRKKSYTVAECEAFFSDYISKAETCVKKTITRPLTQGQFDAFIDLVYQAGCTWFKSRKKITIPSFNRGQICFTAEKLLICLTESDQPGTFRRRKEAHDYFFMKNIGIKC